LDVEGCSGQLAGATMLSIDGLTSLLCESVVTEDAHQDLLNDFNVVWVVVMLHVLWAVVVVVVVFTVLTNVLLIIVSSVSMKKTSLEAPSDINDEVPAPARTALDETDCAKDVDDPQESSSSATEPIFVGRTQRISTEDANDSPTDCAKMFKLTILTRASLTWIPCMLGMLTKSLTMIHLLIGLVIFYDDHDHIVV